MDKKNTLDSVVIRFSGDSGDGMQLTGTQFSNTSANMGNGISTFPDYPSEIRAPQGTIAGVSGFQVHIGSNEILTPGDDVDMLVAMNPAALKANLKALKPNGHIIVNLDAFTKNNIEKAGYTENPLETGELKNYQVVCAPISSQTQLALKEIAIDSKSKDRCKNFYALGMTYFFYNRDIDTTVEWITSKFKKNPVMIDANVAALKAGRNFAETTEAVLSTYNVPAASNITPGTYRQINGNVSTAWGFIRAAEAANLKLFLGSYPITPATDILHELAIHKNFGVKTFQAEDEIAGICTAIGAAQAGSLAITTSSGPGIALKNEALGLAISYEIPLVIVNVQRGGPSTGLPTKTEQADLNQALYGRHGEAPLVVVAASRPNDCFHMAYEASRLALQHMTPVMLLTDGYIANGAEPWRLPDVEKDYPTIKHKMIDPTKEDPATTKWTQRDDVLARKWIVPGMKGFEHQIGGLEKDINTGCVSHDPLNHQKMCDLREKKIEMVADNIPLQTVDGAASGDLLVVSWGGTYGAVSMAVKNLQKAGEKISLMHMHYIHPMPKNVAEILPKFKKIIVPELNKGQLKTVLEAKFGVRTHSYNKMQGLPFKISELEEAFMKLLKEEK